MPGDEYGDGITSHFRIRREKGRGTSNIFPPSAPSDQSSDARRILPPVAALDGLRGQGVRCDFHNEAHAATRRSIASLWNCRRRYGTDGVVMELTASLWN
jgi:hypothetical protein